MLRIKEGIEYYNKLFNDLKDKFEDTRSVILSELDGSRKVLQLLFQEIENLTIPAAIAK